MEIYTNATVNITPREIEDVIEDDIEVDELAVLLNTIVKYNLYSPDELARSINLKKETIEWLKLVIEVYENQNL